MKTSTLISRSAEQETMHSQLVVMLKEDHSGAHAARFLLEKIELQQLSPDDGCELFREAILEVYFARVDK